jgi:alpha-ketoglutaric semialdehyde dehydrogenase
MKITGEALIGGMPERGNAGSFKAHDPATGTELAPTIYIVDDAQIDRACILAAAVFDQIRATSDERRAALLETIGAQIMAIGDELIDRAMAETGLPRVRLEGERGRTVNQLKLFAELLREGSWLDARIDSALPERTPPRPDLRMRMIGLGPVAVFAASNFPLAFSVAGGDTASALAAGCPVVLKAHSAHPGTSELVARAVVKAVELSNFPAGIFALLTGTGNGIGQALVAHPAIQAVGFTGSRTGGQALMAVAAARAQPIPVYAEMSSINPMFLFPHALKARAEQIGAGFAASLTMSAGQLCTNPGLVLGIEGADFDRFAASAAQGLESSQAAPMLTQAIAASYQQGVDALSRNAAVCTLAQRGKGGAALFKTTGADFLVRHELHSEVFGAASLLVACKDLAQICEIAQSIEGQLTVTLHIDEVDFPEAQQLMPILERKAGRILANGFPTGVEVSSAMVHGGPFPATSDGRSTSVGTGAIARFLRPVAYQNMPQTLLPIALRDRNPFGIWRRRDGALSKEG